MNYAKIRSAQRSSSGSEVSTPRRTPYLNFAESFKKVMDKTPLLEKSQLSMTDPISVNFAEVRSP